MPWVRSGDNSATYPLVMSVAGLPGADGRSVNEVYGFVARLAMLSASHTTDYVVDAGTVAMIGGANTDDLVKLCKKVGLLRQCRVDGRVAYKVIDDPDFLHLRLKAEIEWERQQKADAADLKIAVPVRLRDGDQCRYCRAWVDFRLRKGKHRGTYDHIDPADRATFVVCCGDCNSRKGKRTPEQAGMVLLPPPSPDERHFSTETHDKLAALGLLPPRPGSQPDPAPTRAATTAGAATGSAHSAPPRPADHAASETTGSSPKAASTPARRSASEPGSSTDALPRQHPPGRDGAGSGRDGTGTPARASPRGRRGRRGGRRSTTR